MTALQGVCLLAPSLGQPITALGGGRGLSVRKAQDATTVLVKWQESLTLTMGRAIGPAGEGVRMTKGYLAGSPKGLFFSRRVSFYGSRGTISDI